MLSHINVETESEILCFRRDGIVISVINPVRATVTVTITSETRIANLDINSKIFIVFNIFIHISSSKDIIGLNVYKITSKDYSY